jgi:hypothetical protein
MNEMFNQSVFTMDDQIEALQMEKQKRIKGIEKMEKEKKETKEIKDLLKREKEERKRVQKEKEKASRKAQKLRDQALVTKWKKECEEIDQKIATLRNSSCS